MPSGKLRTWVKIKFRDGDYQASLGTLVAVTVVSANFQPPVITGLGIPATVQAIGEGSNDLVILLGPGERPMTVAR
jgi:hypothetical protein